MSGLYKPPKKNDVVQTLNGVCVLSDIYLLSSPKDTRCKVFFANFMVFQPWTPHDFTQLQVAETIKAAKNSKTKGPDRLSTVIETPWQARSRVSRSCNELYKNMSQIVQ